MSMDREALEKLALQTVSTELYYDLADTIDALDDDILLTVIGCGGYYRLEKERLNYS